MFKVGRVAFVWSCRVQCDAGSRVKSLNDHSVLRTGALTPPKYLRRGGVHNCSFCLHLVAVVALNIRRVDPPRSGCVGGFD